METVTARIRTLGRLGAISLLLAVLAFAASPALAGEKHNPNRGAHPLRFIAYVLHPIGFMLDRLLVRPAHWVVSREPLEPVFGHTDDY